MKIAFISDLDARNVRAWSGSTYHMWKGLEQAGATVELITPLEKARPRLLKAKDRFWRLFGRTYSYRGESFVLDSFARQVEKKLAAMNPQPDVIFSCGKPAVVNLNTTIPVVFADDASMPAHKLLYPGIKKLTARCIRQLEAAEQKLLNKALLAVYGAEWAAQAARETYQVVPDKIVAIPWGANIECLRTGEDILRFLQTRRESGVFRILFSGVDWVRKGGDLVLGACEELLRRGVPVELHILGCLPPRPIPAWVTVHGFISKNTAEGMEKINRLYETAHLLFVPSRAEAYGIVFAEASSFGVPSVSTAVGGIPGVVRDGVNGMLLPPDAGAAAYAERIVPLWQDRSAYETLALSAFREYGERLNWKAFGTTVIRLIEERGPSQS